MPKKDKRVSLALFVAVWGLYTHGFPRAEANPPAVRGENCEAWFLNGEDSYGTFHGELQLRSDESALRIVRHEAPLSSGLQLEELWLGKRSGARAANFELVRHRFLSVVGQERFQAPDFSVQQSVHVEATGAKLASCLPVTDEPIRRVERLIDDSDSSPFLVKLAEKLVLGGILNDYQQIPELDPYRNNPEFKSKSHFRVIDTTDQEFYQRNQNVLRVRNQILSEAALTEAGLRRAAYAYSMDEKARRFDQQMTELHLNSLGVVSLRQGEHWIPDGDSALWTGMYVTSQFARYRVTGETQALENAKRGLLGILLLLDVTGNPQTFARSAMIADPAVPLPDWKAGSGSFANIFYLPGGNNDMLHGVVAALIGGYRFLPENDSLRARVLMAMRRIAPLHLRDGARPSQVYVKGLKALADRDPNAYQAFLSAYRSTDGLQNLVGLGHGFYVDGISDWSGVNLTMVSTYTELQIAHGLARIFPHTPLDIDSRGESGNDGPNSDLTAETVESQLKQTLVDMDTTYRSSGRNFVCLLAYAANRSRLGAAPSECRQMLEEVPAEIPISETIAFDSRLRPEFVASPYPNQPWKFLARNHEPFRDRLQGNRIFPIFETFGYASDQIWKDTPFTPARTRPAGMLYPRVDYLFSYWTDRLGEIP